MSVAVILNDHEGRIILLWHGYEWIVQPRVRRGQVDIATGLAVSHHINGRLAPPSAGASFGLIVITPPRHDPKVPHHDHDGEAEMCHLDVEY